MADALKALAHHAYLGLAVIVFLEAIGLPVPAALALVAAGAGAAMGALRADVAIAAAVGAMVAGDTVLYYIGRTTGWWLLGILCRLSANPGGRSSSPISETISSKAAASPRK